MSRFQVVIPSLNQGRFIGSAIRSVLVQRQDVDVELVVVDGCSTDSTPAEIEAALAADPSAKVTVITERDSGQSEAINKGMARGSSEIVSWLNADDILLPGALRQAGEAFAAAPPRAVAVYGDMAYIDETGRIVSRFRAQRFRYGDLLWGPGYIPQPSTFVRRSAWEKVGGVDEELRYAMDIDLWLRLSELGDFLHLPQVLAAFRLHSSSKTISASGAMRAELEAVRRRYAERRLGRVPSTLEVTLRSLGVRSRRKLVAATTLSQEVIRRQLGRPPSGKSVVGAATRS